MMFRGIFAGTVLAVSAVAGALPAQHLEVPPPNPMPATIDSIFDFVVTKFEAEAVVLSDRNYITFHIEPYPGATPSHCYALGTTLTHSLTSVPQTWCYLRHNHSDSDTDSDWDSDQVGSNDNQEGPGNGADSASGAPSSDRIWFSWTMGEDVDLTNPTADGIFGMSKQTGAYLRIVRQVDARTRDQAVLHVPAWNLPVVGDGMFARQSFGGPANFTLPALRISEVPH